MNNDFSEPFKEPFGKVTWNNEAFEKLVQMVGKHNGSHMVTIAGFGASHIYSGEMIHSNEVDYRVELI